MPPGVPGLCVIGAPPQDISAGAINTATATRRNATLRAGAQRPPLRTAKPKAAIMSEIPRQRNSGQPFCLGLKGGSHPNGATVDAAVVGTLIMTLVGPFGFIVTTPGAAVQEDEIGAPVHARLTV